MQSFLQEHVHVEDGLMRINSKFSRFLVSSRRDFAKVYKAHDIDARAAPFEALWLSTVAHATDHVRSRAFCPGLSLEILRIWLVLI